MKKIDPLMDQEQLFALAVQRMNKVFPSEERFDSTYTREKEEALCSADNRYIYFSGPYYFRYGFIDARVIHNLQQGASLLCVGVGEGHLERLLHFGFEIPQENIVITDYPEIHPKIKGLGFREYVFDMTHEWPKFDGSFDYVFFPESLNIATMNYEDEICDRFFNDVEKVTRASEEGKLDELKRSEVDFFMGLIEQDVPVVKARYDILSKALNLLKPEGEVRVSAGIKELQQQPYMKLRLKHEGYNVSYPSVKSGSHFFIKLD